jgi:hypothetical protein
MAYGPNTNERASDALDDLDTRTTALAGIASKASNATASAAPSPRRTGARSHRTALRSLAVLAAIVLTGGAAATITATASGAATDPVANTVKPVGGAPAYGPDPGVPVTEKFVGIASAPHGGGYWVAAADGGVFARGGVGYYGSLGGRALAGPVVGIASTPTGRGYWLAAADGGVFAFGDAGFFGSFGGYRVPSGAHLGGNIAGIAATRTGKGYWLLGADGGVFGFGDAQFYGSAVQVPHATPFAGIATSAGGHGYYLVEFNGGVHTFGTAKYAGSAVDGHWSTGIAVASNGRGYSVVRSDGSVAGFGGQGSVPAPNDSRNGEHPAIGIAAKKGGGAWIARGYNPPPPPPPVQAAATSDLHNDPFLACTRAHESDTAGGYRAVSPGGVYRGAYQFLPSTWSNVARHMGRFDLVGVDPAAASPADQDAVAWHLFNWQGYGPWGNRCMGLR